VFDCNCVDEILWVGRSKGAGLGVSVASASISSDLVPGMSFEASVAMVMVTDVIVHTVFGKGKTVDQHIEVSIFHQRSTYCTVQITDYRSE